MKVKLAYGKNGLEVELPEQNVTVIEPRYVAGLPDEQAALQAAMRNPINSKPLRELARPGQRVAITFCDITRPMPNDRVLPVVLAELESAGIRQQDITLINGTGLHRPNPVAELRGMLGDFVVDNYRVINHNAFDKSTLTYVGKSSYGAEGWVCTEFVQADLKVLTGFIEPHFFAGFSGGPKMVTPAVSGFDTVMHAHNARMIGDPNATWGIIESNPIHTEIREIAAMTRPDFSLNVALNKDHGITAVFAGEMFESHRVGCQYVRETAMQPVPHLYDIVITTNSGYPLDQNLYQAVKGMSAAALVIRPGGAIIAAAECSDGLPNHGNYKDILQMADSPRHVLDLIENPSFAMLDQWQVQVQAKIQIKAKVYLKNSYLNPAQVRAAMLEPIEDIAATVEQLKKEYGPDATICVLPQGPQTIPYLATQPALV
jgi:nickel-dependent lactate racemase